MNIFDALSARDDGKLREVNLSALLKYFLNPAADHGVGGGFLCAFLELVGGELKEGKIFSDIESDQTRVASEVSVNSATGGRKFSLDVVVKLFNEDGGEHTHVLVIENKIRAGAAKGQQLKNYYAAARKKYKNKIIMVFLTPGGRDNKPLSDEYGALDDLQDGDRKVWLRWNGEKSVQSIIRDNILALEAAGKFAPINEYSRHTLKALSMHLEGYNMSVRQTRAGETWVSVPGTDYKISHCNRVNFHVYENGEELRPAREALLKIADELKVDDRKRQKKSGEMSRRPGKIGRAILNTIRERESGV